MVEMVNKDYLPQISKYSNILANSILSKKQVNKDINCEYEEKLLFTLSENLKSSKELVDKLSEFIKLSNNKEPKEKADFIRDNFIETMVLLREKIDNMEEVCPENIWPYPGYDKILFSVI